MTSRSRRFLAFAALYPAWLLFQAVHESGHVLHAAASGGSVAHVELPLLGFSRTVLAANPHPLFVAAGGPLWGSLLPLVAAGVMPRGWTAGRTISRAFAGGCLVANGAYLAVGWTEPAGDAADLLRLGVPVGALVALGSAGGGAGVWMWHLLGRAPARLRRAAESPPPPAESVF